jgi:hypothetical protein
MIAIFMAVWIAPFVVGCSVEKDKLHGIWVVEDGPAPTYDSEGKLASGLPKGMVWEFSPDGKLRWSSQPGGTLVTKEGLSWSVSGDILIMKNDGKEGKARIKELTDDRLVVKDDAQPKEVVFKRSK